MRKICIVGAGAVGGFIGARLAMAGKVELCALARGDTLAALQNHGWRLQEQGMTSSHPARVAEDARQLGTQDLVIIAVKGPALATVARDIQPLLSDSTVILPAMNGVPWWFCAGVPEWANAPIRAVDPQGDILRQIPLQRVLGCSVYVGTTCPEPGLVQHHYGHTFHIGEPLGGTTARVRAVVNLFAEAGFDARLSTDVRQDIWYKLWGNINMNPLSAVTGATMDRLIDDPDLRSFVVRVMLEAAEVGAAIGCYTNETPEERLVETRKLGAFKTSMLQDVEAGRPIELDALVTAVQEIGGRCSIETPSIDALLGIVRVFGRTRGLYA